MPFAVGNNPLTFSARLSSSKTPARDRAARKKETRDRKNAHEAS